MKASIGDRVFVVLQGVRTDPKGIEIRPATVVRDWGGCVNLQVHLDGANDEMDPPEDPPHVGPASTQRPVFDRWLTSISPNEGGGPVGTTGSTIGNIDGYFFNLASAEKAVADYKLVMAAEAAKAAPAPAEAVYLDVAPHSPAS